MAHTLTIGDQVVTTNLQITRVTKIDAGWAFFSDGGKVEQEDLEWSESSRMWICSTDEEEAEEDLEEFWEEWDGEIEHSEGD